MLIQSEPKKKRGISDLTDYYKNQFNQIIETILKNIKVKFNEYSKKFPQEAINSLKKSLKTILIL